MFSKKYVSLYNTLAWSAAQTSTYSSSSRNLSKLCRSSKTKNFKNTPFAGKSNYTKSYQ